jgi:hypothetical protein
MELNNRQLTHLARELVGRTSAEVHAELQRRHLDAQTRIAVLVQIDAATTAHRIRARGLATDGAEYRPQNEMDRLLRRVGVDVRQQYTAAELTTLLQQSDLDAERRIAVRLECQARGLTRDASEADRLLKNLGIEGPVSLEAIERTMDERGWGVTYKNVVKSELQSRGWLKSRGNLRMMRASAETRGTRLVDQRGRPISLKSQPA